MPPAAALLFAEAQIEGKRTEPFLSKPEDWVSVGLLVTALLAGALALWLVERWRKRTAVAASQAGYSQLTDYREMFDRGEITAEEYEKLRTRVSERVKTPAAPTGQPSSPPNSGGPPEAPGTGSPA